MGLEAELSKMQDGWDEAKQQWAPSLGAIVQAGITSQNEYEIVTGAIGHLLDIVNTSLGVPVLTRNAAMCEKMIWQLSVLCRDYEKNEVKALAHCSICQSSFVGFGISTDVAATQASRSLAEHCAKQHVVTR